MNGKLKKYLLQASDSIRCLLCCLLKMHVFQNALLLFYKLLISISHLLFRKSVFSVSGVVHNIGSKRKYSARIISAAYCFRYACIFFQKFNMRIIIKINKCSELCCFLYSSAGVTLDENIISLPLNPSDSDNISSVSEEQSTPHPSSCSIFKINGLGVAFTAKYSLNPLFHENAFLTFLHSLLSLFHHKHKKA